MKAIFLAVLMMAAMGAQAAPNENTGVDCDAVASAGWSVFQAHQGREEAAYSEKYMVDRLETFCSMGVGGFLAGNEINETLKSTDALFDVRPESAVAMAVLISATTQGYSLAAAHSVMKAREKK